MAVCTVDKKVVITSMGHFHPKTVIENTFFDQLDIGSEAGWIYERTGIRERRTILSLEDLARLRRRETTLNDLYKDNRIMMIGDMGKYVWDSLLDKKSLAGAVPELDALICGTSVPDFDIPANGCTIAAKIGYECVSFDANSACSSFVVNLQIAQGLIQTGAYKSIGVFTPERYSLRADYTDRSTCILFGDACAAAVVRANGAHGLELIDISVVSSPSKCDLVRTPVGGYFYQNGKAVQKFAITRTLEVTMALLERNRLKPRDVNYFIGHQANMRMLESAVEKLGLTKEQHLFNVDLHGNQGGAGAPVVMAMNWERFKPGDLVAMAVVGSGLTWGAALFRAV